jgi:MoaA/NifB/PqqE/SkfB family radical SAM enzyme
MLKHYRIIDADSQERHAEERKVNFRKLLDKILFPLKEGQNSAFLNISYDIAEASYYFKPSLYVKIKKEDFSEPVIIRIQPLKEKVTPLITTNYYSVGALMPAGKKAPETNKNLANQVAEIIRKNENSGEAIKSYESIFSVKDIFIISNHVRLKITEKCNEKCSFCNTRIDSPNFISNISEIPELIRELHEKKLRTIIFTGGEPTLLKEFPEIVNFTLKLGFDLVVIETNGILLSSEKYLAKFDKNKKNPDWLLSLHSHVEAINDTLSGTKGFFSRKVRAIQNLISSGHSMRISFVINSLNYKMIEDFVAFINTLPSPHPAILFSLVSPTGSAAINRTIIPSIPEVLPCLLKGLKKAKSLGIRAVIPERCGIPPCMLKEYSSFHEIAAEKKRMKSAFEKWQLNPEDSDREKFEICASCEYDQWCTGVWKDYIRIHGKNDLLKIIRNK